MKTLPLSHQIELVPFFDNSKAALQARNLCSSNSHVNTPFNVRDMLYLHAQVLYSLLVASRVR